MSINQMRRTLIIFELREFKLNKVSELQCALNIEAWHKKSGQQIKQWYNKFFITKEDGNN